MKKLFTSVLIMGMIVCCASAQGYITLYHNGQALENGAVVDVPCQVGAEASVYIGYGNPLDDDARFKIHKNVESLLPEATESFCVDETCYPQSATVSLEVFLAQDATVPESDHDRALHVKYNTPVSGQSVIKYTFRDVESGVGETSVTLRFNAGTGIAEAGTAGWGMKLYPNPASGQVSVDYCGGGRGAARLVVENLAGAEVYSALLGTDCGTLPVNVSAFSAGIYFCGIEVGGRRLCTRKLLVR